MQIIFSEIMLWGILFLLNPGYASGFFVPVLLLISWAATQQPSFKPLHRRHQDINILLKKPWIRTLILRPFFRPKNFSIFWLLLLIFLSIGTGITVYSLFFISYKKQVMDIRLMAWFALMMPFILISCGFIMERLLLQIIALAVIMVPLLLLMFGFLVYGLWLKIGLPVIPLIISVLFLPVYVLDLSRSGRETLDNFIN